MSLEFGADIVLKEWKGKWEKGREELEGTTRGGVSTVGFRR